MQITRDIHEAAAHGRKTRESPKGEPWWQIGPNGILWRAGKVWIPANEPLQKRILQITMIQWRDTTVLERPESRFYGSTTGPTMVRGEAVYEPLRSAHCQLNKARRHKP